MGEEKRRFVRGSANLERERGRSHVDPDHDRPDGQLETPGTVPAQGRRMAGSGVGGWTEWLTDARTRGYAEWFVCPWGCGGV